MTDKIEFDTVQFTLPNNVRVIGLIVFAFFCNIAFAKINSELNDDSNIIQFEDVNFKRALLTIQTISMYDVRYGEWVNYTVFIDANKDGQISVSEAKKVRGYNSGITKLTRLLM